MPKSAEPSLSRRHFLRLMSAAGVGAALSRSALAETLAARRGRPLGVALLGLGNYAGTELAPSLQETKLCRLTGLVSGHPDKAAQWAWKYGVPPKNIYNYDNLEKIADNPDIDIVYVVTPPALHPEFTIRAAKAGKHVISEKPLANSVGECDAMISACQEANVRFSVGYRLFFDPYHTEMRRIARDGDLGPLTKMDGAFCFVFGPHAWRVEKKLAGGGPMMDLGIYVLKAARMAQGGAMPVAVTAHELPKKRPEFFNEVEESMRFGLEFANGAKLDAYSSYNDGGNRFRAEGPQGWIEFPKDAFSYRGVQARTSRGKLYFPMPVHQQARQMDDFAECILTGRPTPVPGEMGRDDIKILMAIYEAARTGQRTLVA